MINIFLVNFANSNSKEDWILMKSLEWFDKEQIDIKEPFPVTNLLHKDKELLALRNNFRAAKKFLIAKFDFTVKLGNKERFDKEQIGIKEPFPMTNLPFTS